MLTSLPRQLPDSFFLPTAQLMYMKSYDRSDGETAKAYAAFTIYRDMGVSRSLKATTEKYYSAECPSNVRRAKGMRHIEEWSSKYNWVDRCRDFDRDIELSNREFLLQVKREKYLARCDDLQINTEAAGFEAIEAARNLTAIMIDISAELRLCRGKKIAEYTARELDLVIGLPNSLKNAISCASGGVQLGADGLGLSDVVQKMTKALEK
jgi:hypothetical protein